MHISYTSRGKVQFSLLIIILIEKCVYTQSSRQKLETLKYVGETKIIHVSVSTTDTSCRYMYLISQLSSPFFITSDYLSRMSTNCQYYPEKNAIHIHHRHTFQIYNSLYISVWSPIIFICFYFILFAPSYFFTKNIFCLYQPLIMSLLVS